MLSLTADKQVGWCPPSDHCGRLFDKIRMWTTRSYEEYEPSYDESEHFLRFLDKYVSRAIGNHQMAKWCRENKDKTLLDKFTSSDIAYTILVYENTREVWEEELSIKASNMTEEEKKNTIRQRKPKYHEGRGKRLKKCADGWTTEGRVYYKNLMSIFKSLIHENDAWNTLQQHWRTYQLKCYGRKMKYDNNEEQDFSLDDDDEESDEEDWRIDLETRDRSENTQIASCESEDEDNDSDDSLVHARSKKRMRQDEPVGAVEGV